MTDETQTRTAIREYIAELEANVERLGKFVLTHAGRKDRYLYASSMEAIIRSSMTAARLQKILEDT